MTPTLPRFVPLGQLNDLRARDDAHLIAYTIPQGFGADYPVKRYASRAALTAFCKAGSAHHALVKDAVPAPMLVNRNLQREQA